MLELPRVIGSVPPELRGIFSAQLPIQGYENQEEYDGVWQHNEPLHLDGIHPDVRHMLPIVEIAVRLGSISIIPGTYLQARIRQGEARDIGVSGLGWHSDRGEEDSVYRRIIVSDTCSTLYMHNGEPVSTPDYHFLLIGGISQHAPQDPAAGIIRTRLQVTRMPLD